MSCTTTVNEPVHSKTYKMTSRSREDSDQPAYSQSLIKSLHVFAGHTVDSQVYQSTQNTIPIVIFTIIEF